MLKFDPKSGTFVLKVTGFSAQGGTLRVTTDRFVIRSDELTRGSWSFRGRDPERADHSLD